MEEKFHLEPLNVDNYPVWSIKMECMLKKQDLWSGVDKGLHRRQGGTAGYGPDPPGTNGTTQRRHTAKRTDEENEETRQNQGKETTNNTLATNGRNTGDHRGQHADATATH